ncbi:flagellar basal body-associated protein FliL [Paenibacillus sp. W4I10]|uniref:GerMN domain-containing protein n=1 Tax=Paenibacillus sp. W4I10 TaxID=3042298 RepID=UPI00278AAE93|nr:GerMN domain-containing protein [Paenibacillus sp. W4I10]MDQ0719523.1 flagellar basal body-associated protein FliL [Paenibacillus sp. W4I10]
MNKKIWIAALLVTVMAVAAGCGSKPTAAPNQTQGAGTENNVTEVEGETITEPVTAEPEENTTPTESTEGGSEEATTTTPPSETSTEKPATSESNEKKTITVFYTDEEELELHKASAEISYASDDAKYKAAFESLQQSKDAKLVPLWSKEIELKSVQFKDGALTLDIHMPDTARLGAGGESYALDALKQTFFQFDEVKSLDLLVDGQQTESLMGHVDLEHPMTRSE